MMKKRVKIEAFFQLFLVGKIGKKVGINISPVFVIKFLAHKTRPFPLDYHWNETILYFISILFIFIFIHYLRTKNFLIQN